MVHKFTVRFMRRHPDQYTLEEVSGTMVLEEGPGSPNVPDMIFSIEKAINSNSDIRAHIFTA